jgi:uncharacterized membrane-anchored protein
MCRESNLTAPVVAVNRRLLFALFVVMWFSVFSLAGIVSGLAQRAGVTAWLANGAAFGAAFILMYPYFAIRLDMAGARARMPPFWRYAVHWACASMLANLAATRVITSFFP